MNIPNPLHVIERDLAIASPPPLKAPITLDQVAKLYLDSKIKSGVSKTQIEYVTSAIKNFKVWMHAHPLQETDPRERYFEQIRCLVGWCDWLSNERKLGYHRREGNIKRIREMFRFAQRNGYITQNPWEMIRTTKPPPPKEKLVFTEREYEALKAATKGTDTHWLIILAWNTGMSLVDCCQLRWSDIKFEDMCISRLRQKCAKQFGERCRQTIPIIYEGELHMALRGWWPKTKKEEFVSPECARRWNTGSVDDYFRREIRVLGLKGKSFHTFRHTMVSRLANAGVNIALAAKITGHHDLNVFKDYVHPNVEALRQTMITAFAKAKTLDNKRATNLMLLDDDWELEDSTETSPLGPSVAKG